MNGLHLIFLLAFAGSAPPLPQALPGAAHSSSSPAEIRFTYQNPRLQPTKYLLDLREDGSGKYRSELGDTLAAEGDPSVQPMNREIQVARELQEKIFRAARDNRFFAIACESGQKNVAFEGTKTLEYEGADGHGSCTYNFTHLSSIQYLTETLEGISLTLEVGALLEVEYRHRPLGLDSELATLQALAERKQAIELGNIAPILTTIANDEKVLKGARRRARSLLASAGQR